MAEDLKLEGAEEVTSGGIIKFETLGQKVVGILIEHKSGVKTSQGEADMYTIKTKDGEVSFFASTILHQKLEKVAIGNVVVVEYTDDKKTNSGRKLKNFSVKSAPATEANLKVLGLEVLSEVGDEITPDDIPL